MRYASLSDAIDTMTWTEYQVIMMLESIYPTGVVRDDLRTALICYISAAAAGAKDVTPGSFFLHDLLAHEPSREQLAQKIMSIATLADRVQRLDAIEHFEKSQNTEVNHG